MGWDGAMDNKSDATLEPSPEQVRYADVLEKGMYVGLACLFVTFAIYLSGILQPYVPPEELQQHWTKSVHEYLENADIKAGWAWVSMLQYGDFINFIGIAILAGVTLVSYIAIIPLLLRSKDTIYVVVAVLEVIVLIVAASGIIAVGH
jgi:hypothetical protein